MSAQKPTQSDRMEIVARGLLALALVAGVAWSWIDGGGFSSGSPLGF